jgi:hypothetical protein
MSNELDQARLIAERIARRVSTSGASSAPLGNGRTEVSGELAAMRAGLSELQKRLSQLEAKIRSEGSPATVLGQTATFPASQTPTPMVPPTHSPWLAGVNAMAAHPSQERFGVEEAAVSELVDFFQGEKTCTVEPGGKPCDHCAMCSSRGF